MPGIPRYIRSRFKNGSVFNAEYGLTTPYTRRIGEKAKITSESGKDGRYRPVTHTRARYFVPVPQPDWYESITNKFAIRSGGPSSTVFCETAGFDSVCHRTAYSRFESFAELSLSLAGLQWDGLAANALSKMMPSFYERNSLINFLYELKDFKHLALAFRDKALGKHANILKAILGLNHKKKRPKALNGKLTMKELSSVYLQYNFGWAPLFNDIAGFVSTMKRFQRKYFELLALEGTVRTARYRQWVDGSAQSQQVVESGEPTFGGWSGVMHRRGYYRIIRDQTKGTQYCASMRYRYKLPANIRQPAGIIAAKLDALGLTSGNPAVVWNAIPYSFVIDWLINVGQTLERLRTDNAPIQTEILDFCHSAKIQRGVGLYYKSMLTQPTGPDSYNYYYGAEVLTDACVNSIYERRIGLPNIRNAALATGLNFRELLLGGALLSANRR